MTTAPIFAEPDTALWSGKPTESRLLLVFSCGRRGVTDDPNDAIDLDATPPRREDGPTFGPFDYAEITYNTIRVTDGDTLAVWDGGDWVLTELAGPYAGETYSDATIWNAP